MLCVLWLSHLPWPSGKFFLTDIKPSKLFEPSKSLTGSFSNRITGKKLKPSFFLIHQKFVEKGFLLFQKLIPIDQAKNEECMFAVIKRNRRMSVYIGRFSDSKIFSKSFKYLKYLPQFILYTSKQSFGNQYYKLRLPTSFSYSQVLVTCILWLLWKLKLLFKRSGLQTVNAIKQNPLKQIILNFKEKFAACFKNQNGQMNNHLTSRIILKKTKTSWPLCRIIF